MVYSATWLVLAILAIILTVFGLGYYWARMHGQFEEIEAAKYAMLENERRYGDDQYHNRKSTL